jgi:intein-encoded DNA endonuclease-like protein
VAKIGLRNALKHSCDEHFFSEIDSQEKAYLLGLFIADGNIHIGTGFTFFFSSVDLELVEYFKKCMQATNPIRKRKDGGYEFVINSKIILEDLSKYGVVPRKSLVSTLPDIQYGLYRHFIRGLFDGDGCIRIDKLGNGRFDICGSYKILHSISILLEADLGLKINITKHGNIFRLAVAGNRKVLKIKSYLYDNSTLFLNRKKCIFNRIKLRYNGGGIMKVKIGTSIYDSEQTPIMIILSDSEKEQVAQMPTGVNAFCAWNDLTCNNMTEEEIKEWMN